MATVLVLEDEPVLSELIREVLEEAGYAVRRARLGGEANDILESEPVDAVIVDRGLPDGDGLVWLESIAPLRPDVVSRSLLMTGGRVEGGDSRRIAAWGASVLLKPFRVEQLLQALAARVDLRAPSDGEERETEGRRRPIRRPPEDEHGV